MVKKLAGMKHKHNKWDWRAFMKEIWSRDSPVRPWGAEKISRIPPPPREPVAKEGEKPKKAAEKPVKPAE